MTGFDIVILVMTLTFVGIGIWKGFARTLLRFGAAVVSLIVARLFGGMLGEALLPKGNEYLATLLGTFIVFATLYLILRIVIKILSKKINDGFKSRLIDKILGGCLGFLLAIGAVCTLAYAVDLVAALLLLFDSPWDIYDAVESSVIFRYFF